MSSKDLFRTTDNFNRPVRLEKERLYNHIIEKSGHVEMKEDPFSIERTIQDADYIHVSSYNTKRDVYFAKGKHKDFPEDYVKVVVDFSDSCGYVVSAWTVEEVGTSIGVMKYEKSSKT